jgi:hypothetical protein
MAGIAAEKAIPKQQCHQSLQTVASGKSRRSRDGCRSVERWAQRAVCYRRGYVKWQTPTLLANLKYLVRLSRSIWRIRYAQGPEAHRRQCGGLPTRQPHATLVGLVASRECRAAKRKWKKKRSRMHSNVFRDEPARPQPVDHMLSRGILITG